MNHHEGVQCDVCIKDNFTGCRFKCLICQDYDLCDECFARGASSANHLPTHPMQSIWTRTDMGLFFGGEDIERPENLSLTCPFCGEQGFGEETLMDHIVNLHRLSSEASSSVLCPICVVRGTGNPNYVTNNLAAHFAIEHQIPGPQDLITGLNETSALALRNIQSETEPRRRNVFEPPRSSSHSHSHSNRNSMDAFFLELMSHLPDVRFGSTGGNQSNSSGGSAASGGGGGGGSFSFGGSSGSGAGSSVQALQQIQMQLRQHQMAARHQLEIHRLARRAFSGQLPSGELPQLPETAPSSATNAIGSNSSRNPASSSSTTTTSASMLHASVFSEGVGFRIGGGTGRATAALRGSGSAESTGDGVTAGGDGAGGVRTSSKASDIGVRAAIKPENDNKFLLKKLTKVNLTDRDHAKRDRLRADRSMFVQSLLMSAFSTNFEDEHEDQKQLQRTSSVSKAKITGEKKRTSTKKGKKKQKKESYPISPKISLNANLKSDNQSTTQSSGNGEGTTSMDGESVKSTEGN